MKERTRQGRSRLLRDADRLSVVLVVRAGPGVVAMVEDMMGLPDRDNECLAALGSPIRVSHFELVFGCRESDCLCCTVSASSPSHLGLVDVSRCLCSGWW